MGVVVKGLGGMAEDHRRGVILNQGVSKYVSYCEGAPFNTG